MADANTWIDATRSSHDRFVEVLTPLTDEQVTGPSYDDDWTIADVASHLGSQAEIFDLFLVAGSTGEPPPGGEAFGPIWDRWNALPPAEQVAQSIAANEAFVAKLESLPETQRQSFKLSMFGQQVDLAGLAALRLGEHAVHTWDIAVALDPAATVAPDAVALLIDTVPQTVARVGQPIEQGRPVVIHTVEPERWFELTLDPAVTLTETNEDPAALRLSAEQFLRLVSGRLDSADDDRLIELRSVFPGF